MPIFSKTKDNRFRKLMKELLAERTDKINNKFFTAIDGDLIPLGHNIYYFELHRGVYFYINDEGVAVGAIHCTDCRDVITVGLGVEHAEAIKAAVFHDAIEGRGIFPLQTMEDSIPPDLREALGFIGPEKDEFTTAKRWVFIK